MKTKIYALRDETRYLRYVGKTHRSLEGRLSGHLIDACRYQTKTHKCDWIRSILKRGFLPSITLIEEVCGDGSKEEISWIKYFRDHGVELVNGTDGGDGVCNPSIEARKKMSDAAKRQVWSAERRLKTSIRFKGKRLSEEHKRKVSASLMGHRHSEETKKKLRAILKRNSTINNPWLGRRHTEETKRKISLALRKKR